MTSGRSLTITFDSQLTQDTLRKTINMLDHQNKLAEKKGAFSNPTLPDAYEVVFAIWFDQHNAKKKPEGKVYEAENLRKKKKVFSTTLALKVNECRAPLPSGPDDVEMQITRRRRALLVSRGGRRPAGASHLT